MIKDITSESLFDRLKKQQVIEEDTIWQLSAKGNYWRNKKGINLVVGTKNGTSYWVRAGDKFLPKWEKTLELAKAAAEAEVM
jgi:hypothetical protein